MNINKHSRVKTVGISSFLALLALLGVAVFCPAPTNEVQAATCSGSETCVSTSTFDIDFLVLSTDTKVFALDFLLAPKLSISLDDPNPGTIDVAAQPTASGNKISGATNFSVTTNATTGLGVYVYGNGNNALVGTNTGNTIPATSTVATSLAGLSNNTWGYNLSTADAAANADSLSYKGLTASKGNADYNTGASGTANLRLTLGAKIDMGTAPDTYSNTIQIQAVPNGTATAAMNEISRAREESGL